jgi:TolB-like protein/DNA-binding winged helix-turn-helix (wHTH) protein
VEEVVNGDFRIGSWLVQPSLNSVSQNGTNTRLQNKVMEVLVCLADQSGHVISKEQLLQAVWPDTFVTDDVLKRSISELRRVFRDDAHESRIIETIPKRGYRLVAAVERVNELAPNIASATETEVSVETRGHGRRNLWKSVALGASGVLVVLTLVFGVGRLRHWLVGEPVPAIRSLAVLPLQSLSDDPKQEYFAEGVTDALITDLAQIGSLRVVSRTTVMGYGRPNKPLPQIARELKVDGIMEGTVQRSGDRVRITAQLIYGPADRHLWANSFERDIKDVLELQGDIAKEIAYQIQVKVSPELKAKLQNARPVDAKALDAYVEARFHLDEATKLEYYKRKRQQQNDELQKAVWYLDTAIREDPEYIPAYVAYLDAVDRDTISHLEYLPKARAALMRALELDPSNESALTKLGRLYMEYDYDWSAAGREIRRAIELHPTSADAHFWYAEYLNSLEGASDSEGDNPDAAKQRALAQALDPAQDYYANAGVQRVGERNLEREREALEEKAPNDPFAIGVMAKNYAMASRYKEAVEMYERCLNLYGWNNFAEVLKRGNAKGGAKYALQEFMRAAEQYSRTHDDLPVVTMAFTYSSLGDKDRAFAWLDKAVEQRSWIILYLKNDDVWRPLRSDPRFSALLRRVGLSPS